ncbi:rhodanese-like domain-containing protein [Patiriisocius hiemis]|uniref:Rhodanese-like domain-containing protein n=1 Tax=Patiriisocius hiemis TaxID=3075604 RepID=A0ABU2YCU3_9FLAO|nr:rhodanese-like domain-containing protein [Constantimarinum sp. W242]MDT0555994.1 rhodanese-like domain-containing protein [Constantimarinum sp. W242]
MKKLLFFTIALSLLLVSCNSSSENIKVLPPTDFNKAVTLEDNSILQLIDVRTAEEFEVGHLKDSQNICVTEEDFEEKVKNLNKDEPVYVYCKKGGRSARAAKILRDLGFTKVYDLEGGITSWTDDGLEVVE